MLLLDSSIMKSIEDLPCIQKEKLATIKPCLDQLLMQTPARQALITGYNWYDSPISSPRIVTFSHMHEDPAYREAMLNDLEKLGYRRAKLEGYIRPKRSAFHFDPRFRFRDEAGKVFTGLTVRHGPTAIELSKYTNPLAEYPELADINNHLIGEDAGWEINLRFRTREQLLRLSRLFVQKSTDNSSSVRKHETDLITAWPAAYHIPVIILGKNALSFTAELPQFAPACRVFLEENKNEINFIVDKTFKQLHHSQEYRQLLHLGFQEEECLANKAFL